jgi:glycosyltransferase involved in cell wall biosynthesis
MKILVLSPFLPYPEKSGSRIRTMTLLRSLAGHDVFLAAFREDDESVPEDVLKGLCREHHVFPRPRLSSFQTALNVLSPRPLMAKRFANKDARRTVRRIIENEGIEVIISEAVLVAEYARPVRGVFKVLDAHNLEFMRARGRISLARAPLKKLAYRLIASRMKRYEKRALGDFDLLLLCSEADRKALEEIAPGKRALVIPNAVDTDAFIPGAGGATRPIIFTGTLWYEPNLDAARWLAEDIFPLIRSDFPDMELLIVGDHPPAEVLDLTSRPGISVIGPVEDIRPYLSQALIFLAPIRTGSGTRQKILDAMAMGLPVVSTPIGCEGLEAVEGESISLAKTPAEFREKVRRLVQDPGFRSRLARGGRKLVEQQYSRGAVIEKLAALFRAVEAEVRRRD